MTCTWSSTPDSPHSSCNCQLWVRQGSHSGSQHSLHHNQDHLFGWLCMLSDNHRLSRYVSLFPLLMRLLPPDSHHLQQQLADLRNPALLWTDFGLRSLSKSSSMYNAYNTEHDPPYWRAPIWININYLALASLHFYAQVRHAMPQSLA